MYNIIQFIKENNIKSVLDIGANVGDWAFAIKQNIPNIKIFSIEANPECETSLKSKNLDYKICCLSDIRTSIKFYKDENSKTSTGCSYYLENTNYFNENNFVDMETSILDSIINNDEIFEYIKIDTQGQEIDIIKGGLQIINKCRFLQLETSCIEYNINSPMKDEVFNFMKDINFEPIVKVENHYMNQKLIQEDFIFKNNLK